MFASLAGNVYQFPVPFAFRGFQPRHGALGQQTLIAPTRVARDHARRAMQRDGHDLGLAGAALGERRRVAQALDVQIGETESVEMIALGRRESALGDRPAGSIGDGQESQPSLWYVFSIHERLPICARNQALDPDHI
jgi:hypothetical protein